MTDPSDRGRAPTVFGVHAGLQNTDTDDAARPVAAHRGPRLRLDLDLGPLLRRQRQRRRRLPGGGGHARRAGLRHQRGSAAARSSTPSATATRRCWPTPSAPSTTCRAAGPTSASAPGGARSSTDAYGIPFPPVKVRMDQLEEAHPVRPRPAARRGHDLRGQVLPAARGPVRAQAGAGRAADLDRRRGREAHPADRRPLGRRLERPVRRPGHVRPQARRAPSPTATTSAATRPRSAPRSTWGWPGPRRASAQQFGGHGRLRAARRAHRLRRARCSIASAGTSRPAPTR